MREETIDDTAIGTYSNLNERLKGLKNSLNNVNERLEKYGEVSTEVSYRDTLINDIAEVEAEIEKVKDRFTENGVDIKQIDTIIEERNKVVDELTESRDAIIRIDEKIRRLDKNNSEYETIKKGFENAIRDYQTKIGNNYVKLQQLNGTLDATNGVVDVTDLQHTNVDKNTIWNKLTQVTTEVKLC